MSEGRSYFLETEIDDLVLGLCLFDSKQCLDYFRSIGVEETWFERRVHREIWQSMVALQEKGEQVDVVTTSIYLDENFKYPNVDSNYAHDVSHLSGNVYTTSQKEFVGLRFVEYTKKRKIVRFLSQVLSSNESPEYLSDAILAILDNGITKIRNLRPDKALTMAQIYEEILSELSKPDYKPKRYLTGLDPLDDMIGGLYCKDFSIFGGPPGIGKTCIVMNILDYNNQREGIPVAYFCLEMGRDIIGMRNLSSQSKVPLTKIRDGEVNLEKLSDFIEDKLSTTFFVIEDVYSIHEIEARAKQLVSQNGVKIIVLDYMQLCDVNLGYNTNREQEVSYIGRTLKRLAKQTNAHVIGISNLDDRWEGKPTQRNLRDSKALGNHADNVLLLYKKDTLIHLNVDKGRNNATGEIQLRFEGDLTLFSGF